MPSAAARIATPGAAGQSVHRRSSQGNIRARHAATNITTNPTPYAPARSLSWIKAIHRYWV